MITANIVRNATCVAVGCLSYETHPLQRNLGFIFTLITFRGTYLNSDKC